MTRRKPHFLVGCRSGYPGGGNSYLMILIFSAAREARKGFQAARSLLRLQMTL
jgi:hypothetical protein